MSVDRGFRGLSLAEEDFEELVCANSKLLEGVPPEKRRAVLRCMDVQVFRYAKGASLKARMGKPKGTLYLVKGNARVERLDIRGERTILYDSGPDMPLSSSDIPNVFAEEDTQITALDSCTVICFNFSKDIESCPCCVKYVSCVRKNVLRRFGVANAQLVKRLDILSRRSIRAKIAAYLTFRLEQAGTTSFEVAMTRQEFADYLCVERSALSREIGKMRADGIFNCTKGRFEILKDLSSYV